MSRQLREALREVATGSPALSPPPSGLFDRARREQTRRRVTTVLATILAVATVAVSTGFFPAAPVVTASSIVLPRHFVGPPKWTADIRDAPVERAVLAFVKSIEPQKLVIIGPESVYRTYSVPAEGYSTWTPSFLLSPDGRSVLVARGQRTELLDLGTGRVTLLEIGAPLAWSRDGTHAVVVNEAASEFHVVQIPAGIVVWRIPMRPAEELVAAAFSPDLTRLAVQQGSTMSVYQRSGMLWSKEVGMTPALAGPLAWTPDGAAIALAKLTSTTVFDLLDAQTGNAAGQIASRGGLNYVGVQGRAEGLPSVVAWHGDIAVVNVGNRALFKLDIPYNVLMTAAEGTRELQVTSIGTDWAATDPSPPDPGPVVQRYRAALDIALPGVLGVLLLIVLAVRFRRGGPRLGRRG